MKICSKCNTGYYNTSDSFHKRKNSLDGYSNVCKACKLKNRHRFNHINEEGLLLCVKCNLYKEESNFDIRKEKWFRKGRENRCKQCKFIQYNKRRLQNRGDQGFNRIIIERFYGLRDRAKKHKEILDFDKNYLIELWDKQKGICAISGLQMTVTCFDGRTPTNLSVDRIDTNKGYTKDNIQLVCMAVNQMKSDFSMETLLLFCKNILKYNKKNEN